MSKEEEYVERAKDRIAELLTEHHALVHPEVISRISEGYYIGDSKNIDPHHVTTALRELHTEDVVHTLTAPTRAGHKVATLQLVSPPPKTTTAVARAAARKRLLLARYTGWSQGTIKHPHGLIGPAGEEAVRAGLAQSGAMQPAVVGFAPVSRILNTSLPGPADSGGFLVPIDSATRLPLPGQRRTLFRLGWMTVGRGGDGDEHSQAPRPPIQRFGRRYLIPLQAEQSLLHG